MFLHVGFLFVMFCLAHMNQGSTIETFFVDNPHNVSGALGREAQLNCSVVGAKHFKVAWIGLSRGTVLSLQEDKVYDHPRVSIRHSSSSNGIDSFILTIKDITPEDTGSYLCQVNTRPALKKIYTLSLVASPKIRDDYSSSDIEVAEGGRVNMTCKAEGKPQPEITWRREDSKLIRLTEAKETKPVEGDNLTFLSADRSHAGAYLCIAKNGILPSVSKRIQLNVRFQPEIKPTTPILEVEIGTMAELHCDVTGYPRPQIIWIKEKRNSNPNSYFVSANSNKQIKMGGRFRSGFSRLPGTNNHRVTLRIQEVQARDYGTYRCTANNSEGSHEATVIFQEKLTTTTTSTTTSTTTTSTTTTKSTTTSTINNHFFPTNKLTGRKRQIEKLLPTLGVRSTPSPQKQSYYSADQQNGGDRRRKFNETLWTASVNFNSQTSVHSYSGYFQCFVLLSAVSSLKVEQIFLRN